MLISPVVVYLMNQCGFSSPNGLRQNTGGRDAVNSKMANSQGGCRLDAGNAPGTIMTQTYHPKFLAVREF